MKMSHFKINHSKKSTLILILISIWTIYPIFVDNTIINKKIDTPSNFLVPEFGHTQIQLQSSLKWKKLISKADLNGNWINDNFEIRLKKLSEFGFVEKYPEDHNEKLDMNNILGDCLKSKDRKTEKITKDEIPIIISFPDKDFVSTSFLFESLGGKIKAIYKAAINGFAGRISYDAFNEFYQSLKQKDIPFFIEEDGMCQADLYYTSRNMNLRPYVWNTLSYDGDENSSIAIIDTGIDDAHDFFGSGYSDGDFNYKMVGWYDVVGTQIYPYDDNGHGSHCSGISTGEGGPDLDHLGRAVATTADFQQWDDETYENNYTASWARFNVTDPGTIDIEIEFTDLTSGPDDVDLWVYLFYGDIYSGIATLVDYYQSMSDSWTHNLTYTVTAGELGMYSFVISVNYVDQTGDGKVDYPDIQFRSKIHWPFDPPDFGSGDVWKGVAPDAHLVGVKVLDAYGDGDISDLVTGIDWVITNKEIYNITVISMSLGGEAGHVATINAVNNAVEAGIVTVTSAGNNGPVVNNIRSPGDADNVITVAANNLRDEITYYSSQGGQSLIMNTSKPDITAPGGSFFDLQMFSADTGDNDNNGEFTDWYEDDLYGAQGTSMSCPAVAGAANLLIESMGGRKNWGYTGLEAKRVKALLLMSATETYPLQREFYPSYSPTLDRGGKDVHEGYGRLNVDIAIEAYTQELTQGSQINAWITSSLNNSYGKHGLGCYVNLINGETYAFTLDVPSGADFDLHLYSDNPNPYGEPIMVASSTSAGLGTDESILYTPTATEKYYLIAKAISGEGNANISSLNLDHDLHVTLKVPTKVEIDNTYIINATVNNTGANPESSVELFLYFDDVEINSTTISYLPVGASETITYTWIPPDYGTYNFTVYAPPVPDEAYLGNNFATELITIWGNYTMILGTPYKWIDASGGTELILDDDDSATISLPFDFTFYNETFSTVYLSSNGYLSFSYMLPWIVWNQDFPLAGSEYSYMIAPFWDDLDPEEGGNIYVQSFGTYWVAEWHNIYHYDRYLVGSFEVILYETGEIVFNYDYLDYMEPFDNYTCGLNLGVDTQFYNSYNGLNESTDDFSIQFIYEGLPRLFELDSNAGIPDDDGVFTLTWDFSPRAMNYSVYESSSNITVIGGSLTSLATETIEFSLPLSGYTDGTYFFIVVAHNKFGDTLSNCIEVVVELGQPPNSFVLNSDAGSPDDDGDFNLTWNAATGAVSYSVYQYSSNISIINNSLTSIATDITSLSHPITGYINGTYYFIVIAHNSYGDTLSNCIKVEVAIPPEPEPEPDGDREIPGYNFHILIMFIAVVSIIILKKQYTHMK